MEGYIRNSAGKYEKVYLIVLPALCVKALSPLVCRANPALPSYCQGVSPTS